MAWPQESLERSQAVASAYLAARFRSAEGASSIRTRPRSDDSASLRRDQGLFKNVATGGRHWLEWRIAAEFLRQTCRQSLCNFSVFAPSAASRYCLDGLFLSYLANKLAGSRK